MFQILNIFSKTFLSGCYGNKAYLTLSYAGGGGGHKVPALISKNRIFATNTATEAKLNTVTFHKIYRGRQWCVH